MESIKINKLPVPTWTWLKVNDKNVKVPSEVVQADMDLMNIPEEVNIGAISFSAISLGEQELGAGDEFRKFSDKSGVGVTSFTVPAGTKCSETLRLSFDYSGMGDAAEFLSRTAFVLGEESELTCVIMYKGMASFAASDIRIKAAKKAKFTLVEIIQLEDGSQFVGSIGGRYKEKGGLRLIQISSGKGNVTLSCAADLNEYKSTLEIETGYLTTGNDNLDINYVARHRGKNTDTKIAVNGVLRDTASKTFRGTIDFIKGCKDATGDEREDVLLMDEGVHNVTVPLILCAEEDVEGAHGASIGKISDEVMFYLQTRGIPEDDIIELLANSRITAIASRIPDEETKKLFIEEE